MHPASTHGPALGTLALGSLLACGALVPAVLALALLHGRPELRPAVAENGPVEALAFLAFMIAALGGFRVGLRMLQPPRRALSAAAVLAFAAGCLLIAGEEIAWGQWIVGFETPEAFRAINEQGETTLHNVKGLQGKSEALRLLFGLGGLAGYLLGTLPALRPIRPPLVLVPLFVAIALLGAGELVTDHVALPVEAIHDGLRSKVFSEWQELVIGGTAVAYVAALARRRRHARPASADLAPV